MRCKPYGVVQDILRSTQPRSPLEDSKILQASSRILKSSLSLVKGRLQHECTIVRSPPQHTHTHVYFTIISVFNK